MAKTGKTTTVVVASVLPWKNIAIVGIAIIVAVVAIYYNHSSVQIAMKNKENSVDAHYPGLTDFVLKIHDKTGSGIAEPFTKPGVSSNGDPQCRDGYIFIPALASCMEEDL